MGNVFLYYYKWTVKLESWIYMESWMNMHKWIDGEHTVLCCLEDPTDVLIVGAVRKTLHKPMTLQNYRFARDSFSGRTFMIFDNPFDILLLKQLMKRENIHFDVENKIKEFPKQIGYFNSIIIMKWYYYMHVHDNWRYGYILQCFNLGINLDGIFTWHKIATFLFYYTIYNKRIWRFV